MFRLPLHIIRSGGWSVMLGLALLGGCATETNPPALQTKISEVEVTPHPVTTNYTAVVTVALEDSLTEAYRMHWQWQHPDGSSTDTTSEATRFYWTAPPQPGNYKHTVWVESPEGLPLSEKYTFSVKVTPWDPPPSSPTLSGKIVFSAIADEQYQIFSMNADGTNLRQLTDWERGSRQPSWSPDGTQIVFASGRDGSAHTSALWVMDADGGNPHPLHPGWPFPLLGNFPRWSPDGEKIAYSYYDGAQTDIYVYDRTTQENIRLTHHPADDGFPAWSPDGNRVVFTSGRDYTNADNMRYRKDLYLINSDGSGLIRLTANGYATRPEWSPNGFSIVYEWNIRGNEIFLLDIYTEKINKLNTGLEFTGNPLWNKNGIQLLVFGRQMESSESEMRLLKIEEHSAEILQIIMLNESTTGWDYDWYSGE
ncbi:MAG: hypothetical protein FH748_09690 [Balneolaceae bacterium]|nr:hypothetical protein [Balneolaceae bacterium]